MARATHFWICVGFVFLSAAHAQEEAPQPGAIVGAPFSAIGVQDIIRTTADGNRFVRTTHTQFYRDGQGRTRTEHELFLQHVSKAVTVPLPVFIGINDKVSGDFYFLESQSKTAQVVHRSAAKVVEPSNVAPPLHIAFAGMSILSNDPGWSAPDALGEKSIEGITATGIRRVYTLAAGAAGNEKPVTITVEQWYSAQLGAVLLKSSHASTGGESRYRLTQIVQAEPDPALFTIPSDYKKIAVPMSGKGTATGTIATSSTSSTETVTKQ